MTVKEILQLHLDNNNLPGNMLAMLEERIYAILYLNKVFIVSDPLDGFYGLCEDFPTLQDYIIYNGIGNEISIEEFIETVPEIYDKDKLINEIRLAYAEVA